MHPSKYPSLYQVNTRVWLTELSASSGKKATLDDIPDQSLKAIAKMGFDWIWFMNVWATGEKGKKISRENPEWRLEYEATLTDLKEDDIGGSGFAVAEYIVDAKLGGDEALKRLRKRMHKHGLKLMLDFVPNHLAPDHPWVEKHPDYFIQGTSADIESQPQNYTRLKQGKKEFIFAYGRDPYFHGWPDTIQLDYSNPAVADAMKKELVRIAAQCDGMRCDMAMLVLPEVFEQTWNRPAQSFWPEAIQAVRKQNPDFCFLAEVYWDMEWTLHQIGFDYAYDKRLYDRICGDYPRGVREHLHAGLDYQDKLVRFLENHDELRAASIFDLKHHEAAAILTFLLPGMRFFHQGELEGKTKRISPHLVRGPKEETDTNLQRFYTVLLDLLRRPIFREGKWRLVEPIPAWMGNDSWDDFIAFTWDGTDGERILVVVNYANNPGQCYLRMPFMDIAGKQWRLEDVTGGYTYDRDGNELYTKGLYLDVQPWQYHVFEMKKV